MPKRNLAWIALILLAALASFRFLPDSYRSRRDGDPEVFRPLAEVYHRLDQKYVRRLDAGQRRRIIEDAVKGMVGSLGDDYSEYFTPEQADDYAKMLKGYFTGVGISIEMRDGVLTVITPIESSPAYAAGIMPGDQIVAVDGAATKGWTLEKAAQKIAGPEGTRVELTIRRNGAAALTFRLDRKRVQRGLVKGFQANDAEGWDYVIGPPLAAAPGVGYIRVQEFVKDQDNSTMKRFKAGLEKMRSAGARGLIIDLRDNGGGILPEAVELADLFIADGVIITLKGAHRAEEVYRASPAGTVTDLPIVVLINEFSASASEIVAGSLADHRRAVLVGQRSFGKATMQEIFDLDGVGGPSKAMLKLTTAYYYLPSGRNINRNEPPRTFDRAGRSSADDLPGGAGPSETGGRHRGGIVPTVPVKLTREEQVALHELRMHLDTLYPGGHRPTTRPDRSREPAARSLGATTQTDPAASPAARSITATTRPDEWPGLLLQYDRQLAAAVEILATPGRYEQELARTPATAPDEP